MTEEKKATPPEDREVETIFGWCTTGEDDKCIVWNRWTHCIYVCSCACHKGKERPPLAALIPPWDALPRGATRKKKPPVKKDAAPETTDLTPEDGQDMIVPDEPADDGSETREQT